ncbi:unnamed protein product [Phyllotreta striolata]|uniref:DUF4729 domain-containing protein n=1 Tax=Phyllotreta striolata TaxID=444603 RepID=A0A9N9TR57_PHYSR|nr:unnamed protein product [Phyllotreta striolata]
MEEANHWTTVVKCNLCGEIPNSAPLYQCPLQHQYCIDCFADLKCRYRGYLKNGATCVICRISGVFTQSKINTSFLNKIKVKPGIGRPYRYNVNQIINKNYQNDHQRLNSNEASPPIDEEITVESLFQLPTEDLKRLLSKNSGLNKPFTTKEPPLLEINKPIGSTSSHNLASKMPIKCPHKLCKKIVAPSTFVTHFKHEHSTTPKYTVERNKEICLPCDVSIIEYQNNFCLAMITVYEFNKIDVKKSQSSQSVIKTCGKFSQQVPIDSFWLMVTGPPHRKPNISSAIFWLFCPSEERYRCTLELCSKYDSISLSTYCEVHSSCQRLKFNDIAACLHCLLVSTASLGALLQEGPELNLRITIH